MNKIKAIYLRKSTIPYLQLNDILNHDLWLDADTCKKFGLVDEINLILKSLANTTQASTPFISVDGTFYYLESPIGFELPHEFITRESDILTEKNSVVVITTQYNKNFASLIEKQKKLHPF